MPSEVGTSGGLKQELGIDMVMFLKARNRERREGDVSETSVTIGEREPQSPVSPAERPAGPGKTNFPSLFFPSLSTFLHGGLLLPQSGCPPT